jgi:hypothetical protein
MSNDNEINKLTEERITELENKKSFLENEIRRAQTINLRGGILGVNMPIVELKRNHRNVSLELERLEKNRG